MTTLICTNCGLKPLGAFTAGQQRTRPSVAAARLCIACQAAAKEERDAENKQKQKLARQKTCTSFVTVELGNVVGHDLRLGPVERCGDRVFAAGKLSLSRVKLICSSNAVLAPAKASTRVRAVTVQKLRLAGAIVPVGLADGAVVVFPCKPQPQPQKSRRGARFQYSYVIIDDKEVPLKNSIWVTPFEKGAEPVITASQIDLTPMDQEKRDAVSAAKKLKGTVFCVWRDGDLSHADLKAFVVRKDWDGFLVACGTYAKEVTYEPGILAEEAYMAVCLLGNYDGQLMQVLFGSYGTVDGALEDATLQVAANLCQRAKNLEALFDETTPLDLVRAARLSQQGKPVGWRTGDVAFRRLSAYVVARPPCVSVALNASGSVTIKAWCGPGDVRPCDTIDEAAKLADRKNSLIHEQNQAGELLKAMLQEY